MFLTFNGDRLTFNGDYLVWSDAGPSSAAQQPGGFIPRPVIYVDKDGKPAGLKEAVRQIAEAATEDAPPERVQKVERAADRVIATLDVAGIAADRVVRDLARFAAILERIDLALAAELQLAIQRERDRQDDEDAAFLLLMS